MYTQKTTTATKKNRTNEKPTGKRLRVKEDVKTSSLKKKKKGGQNKRCPSAKEDKKEDLQNQKITKKTTFKTRKLQISWAPKCWSHSAFPRLFSGLE